MLELRRAITPSGVPGGAITPHQVVMSKSLRPASATVGTSGSSGNRFGPVTASARDLPEVMKGSAAGMLSMIMVISPPASAISAWPLPL